MKTTILACLSLTLLCVAASHAAIVTLPPDLAPGDQYRLIFTTSQQIMARKDCKHWSDLLFAADSSGKSWVSADFLSGEASSPRFGPLHSYVT